MVASATLNRPRTHAGIRSAAEVEAAAARIGAFRRIDPRSVEHGNGGEVAYLGIGPSRVKLGRRGIDTMTPLFGMDRSTWIRENVGMGEAGEDDNKRRRGKITGWSERSRQRMRETLGCLDYSPMFLPGRQLPKMVTLTLPARWEDVAPSAQAFKRRLVDIAVKQRFRRDWGYELVGVWKLEFQRRGAPHLHILTAPPSGTRRVGGRSRSDEIEDFERWLRRIWSDACRLPDSTSKEVAEHFVKGVHIVDTYGLSGTDAKRIADYFVKHGVFSAKEYQNRPPELWSDENGERSPGRFWGYWGLNKADGEAVLRHVIPDAGPAGGGVQHGPGPTALDLDGDSAAARGRRSTGIMSDDETTPGYLIVDGHEVPVDIHLSRVMRRWAKANGKHRKVRTTIPDERRAAELVAQFGPDAVLRAGGKLIDAATGEVLERRSSRWHGPFVRRNAGFISVNDGVNYGEHLEAVIAGSPLRAPAPSHAAASGGLVRRHGARIVDDIVDERIAARESEWAAYYEAIKRHAA